MNQREGLRSCRCNSTNKQGSHLHGAVRMNSGNSRMLPTSAERYPGPERLDHAKACSMNNMDCE